MNAYLVQSGRRPLVVDGGSHVPALRLLRDFFLHEPVSRLVVAPFSPVQGDTLHVDGDSLFAPEYAVADGDGGAAVISIAGASPIWVGACLQAPRTVPGCTEATSLLLCSGHYQAWAAERLKQLQQWAQRSGCSVRLYHAGVALWNRSPVAYLYDAILRDVMRRGCDASHGPPAVAAVHCVSGLTAAVDGAVEGCLGQRGVPTAAQPGSARHFVATSDLRALSLGVDFISCLPLPTSPSIDGTAPAARIFVAVAAAKLLRFARASELSAVAPMIGYALQRANRTETNGSPRPNEPMREWIDLDANRGGNIAIRQTASRVVYDLFVAPPASDSAVHQPSSMMDRFLSCAGVGWSLCSVLRSSPLGLKLQHPLLQALARGDVGAWPQWWTLRCHLPVSESLSPNRPTGNCADVAAALDVNGEDVAANLRYSAMSMLVDSVPCAVTEGCAAASWAALFAPLDASAAVDNGEWGDRSRYAVIRALTIGKNTCKATVHWPRPAPAQTQLVDARKALVHLCRPHEKSGQFVAGALTGAALLAQGIECPAFSLDVTSQLDSFHVSLRPLVVSLALLEHAGKIDPVARNHILNAAESPSASSATRSIAMARWGPPARVALQVHGLAEVLTEVVRLNELLHGAVVSSPEFVAPLPPGCSDRLLKVVSEALLNSSATGATSGGFVTVDVTTAALNTMALYEHVFQLRSLSH